MISFAATPQSKEAQQARAYTDASAGAPPSRRSGSNAPYVDRDHWNKVFTDQTYFDSLAKQKGMAEGAKVSLHGDDYVYRQAMIGYLSATRNVPLDDMRSIFDAEKDSFAQKVLGKQTASARELFDWHKSKFERDNEKQGAARQIMEGVIQRSLQDALSGGDTPFVESVAKDIDAASEYFDDEEKSRLWEKAEELDMKIRATQDRFAPEARFIFDALQQYSGQKTGFGAPDMRDLAGRFANLPDSQRKAIYELVGGFASITKTDKGFFYQLAESLGRGTTAFTERIPRNFREQTLRGQLRLLESDQPVFRATGVAGAEFSAAGSTPVLGATQGQMLTPEEREQAIAKIQSDLGVLQVERELRDLAERVVDPIKMTGVLPEIIEEGLYGAAQSIPYTVAAAVPFAGVPAVAAALFSSNYDNIMLEYPDIDPDKAALIAAISAPIEAGLERMKVNTITGRLPVFGGLVKRLQHPNQRNLTRILVGSAGVIAEQNLQEIAQNATFPLVQTIAATLDQDMPDYDWAKRIEGMPRELAVQFVALLPLSLMGIGALSYREISRGEQYLRSKDNLERAGYNEEQIDRITGAATADEAQSALREESKKRDPKLVKAAAQRIVDESIALREKANPAALPRLEKQGADYVVLSPEGKELARERDQTAAEQALISARRETVQREMRDVHTGINEAVAFIQRVNEARQRGEDVAKVIRDYSPRTLFTQYQENPTPKNLDVLFETARFFGANPKEPKDLQMFPVTGSNIGALREGIWRSIIRINDGADGTIVMREFAQDNLKRAIAEKRVTMDWVRQQLNEILPQIESDRINRRLKTKTDTDVVEAFSDVALAYFRGSIREEQVPEGLRGFFRRMAIIVSDIFRRAYNLARLRAEGRLDRDFEALLAEAVGVNQQALVDRARERTEQEVGAGQNYSIGISPAMDADYLAAVERGDMETAQRMVDEAARRAGYNVGRVFHGTKELFNIFKATRYDDGLIFFHPRKDFAKQWARNRKPRADIAQRIEQVRNESRTFVNGLFDENPDASNDLALAEQLFERQKAFERERLDGMTVNEAGREMGVRVVEAYLNMSRGVFDPRNGNWREFLPVILQRLGVNSEAEIDPQVMSAIENGGYIVWEIKDVADQVFAKYDGMLIQENQGETPETIALRNPNQIKSADPVTYDADGNVIPLSQRFDATTADINYSIGSPAFQTWFADSKVVDENGNPLVVFHGTRRPDRVGNRFRKSRATSGPMSFFTADPEIASGYATNKKDTSFEPPSSYTGWFKYKGKGMRAAVDIDAAWWRLSDEERNVISERIYTVGFQNRDEGDGPIVADSRSIMGRDSIDYELRQARGNALRALVEIWLSSGTLFNREQEFMNVLAAAGMPMQGVTYNDPWAVQSAVYPVYLSIKNPLVTTSIPADAVSALEQASKRKRRKRPVGGDPDLWDKNSNSGAEWMAVLREDIAKNSGLSWTSIPDWVTETLKDLGYDGIRDVGGKYGGSPHDVWIPFEETQVKSATGNRGTFDPTNPRIDYSISTQSEIDRVGAALNRLDRGPSERITQYAALKERLTAALERNRPIMQSMRGDMLPQDFDRTRILNDLGFLDYILKVLPPEVRGRVGGYTNLASIAPVDVYKGDQKVSEAKNPAGAIISAWMREGQNIGQAQKNTALPEGYSTVPNTTDERRDKTIANFLIDRLKKIDRELERYYKRDLMQRIFDVLDKSRPKAGESGVKRSTLGPETQKFADMVYRASLLDDVKTPKRLAQIEAEITSIVPKDGDPESVAQSQKEISELSEEWTIVNTFGDLKNRSSETLASGLEWLQSQLKAGRESWRIKEAARIQENRERAAKVIAYLGKPTDVGRFENKSRLQRFLQAANAIDLDHKSFEQFAVWLFGDEVAAELSEKMMRANINVAKTELEHNRAILAALREGAKAAGTTRGKALAAFKENQPNAVRKLEGRNVKPVKISIELAKKIVRGLADRGSLSNQDVQTLADELASLPRDTKKENVTIQQVIFRGEEVRLTLSKAQAMQLWLTWQQTDAQEKMRKDGFNEDSIADIEDLLADPFSQTILRFMRRTYGSGYGITNPIYARMFGMNMPMVRNYAPARYLSEKEVKDVGLDGSPLTAGGQPSFAKSRVSHSAKLAPEDALTVLQGHLAMQAHFVAFAELHREYRSLLSNPEVRQAIRQQYGDDVLRTAEMWGDQMEQRGGNKAREIKWLQNLVGTIIGGQSVSLLGLNLKSLAMQSDNFMRFFLALDSRQIGSALSDPVALLRNIKKVWKTDILQTRIEGGATAETRFFFERFVSMFRRGTKVAELSMVPMNYTDSAGLSVSGAIVYEAAYKDAIESGMNEQSAEQAAKDAVEAMVYRYGQPVLMGQKSNIENSGNVFTKSFFLFMSDPRLKMALISDAVRGLANGRGDWKTHVRRIVAIELMAVVSHVLATYFRDLTSDDEDEDLWSVGGFGRALLLAPFQGYFLLGTATELLLSRLMEGKWFTPTQNPLVRVADTGLRAFSNLDDALNFDDPDALVKEWTNITRTIAVAPPLAAPAVIMNLVRPLVQGWEYMDDDE